jgi:hypothetical protein
LHGGDGKGVRGRLLRGVVPQQKTAPYRQQQESRAQREPEPAAVRLFQNRTVGLRMGHPDLTR